MSESWFERYKQRVQLYGKSSQERIMNEKIRDFDRYIRNTPNRFEVNIDNSTEQYLIVVQDVTLNNKYGDEKYVVTYNETPMKIGSVFSCLGNTWIISEKEHNVLQDHQTFKVRPCNHILKWIDETGELQQYPCIVQNQTLYTTGIIVEQFQNSGNARESIVLPSNENTLKIKRDKRFIINDNFWKVTNINTDTDGIINLTCLEDKYNSATDNIEKQIADYKNNIHQYKLEVKNKKPILLNINENLTLDIVTYDNDIIIENPQLQYFVNTDIIKIENNTIIPLKTGATKFIIKYKNIKQEIEISIIEDNNKNYSVLIDGNNYIKWGRQSEYNTVFKVDNSKYNNICDYYITDLNNKKTDLAEITSKINNKCVIKANQNKKSGFILLHCVDNIGLHETKKIEIKSLWV